MHLSSQRARPTRCASGRRRPALAVLGGIRAPRPPGGERLLRSCSIQHFCTSPADPATPPRPNWRNPDRLREVGGGGASRGTAPPRRCASGILARCGRGAAGQFGANHLPPAKWKTSLAAIFLFFQFCQWSQRPNLQTPVVTYWKVVGTLIFLG